MNVVGSDCGAELASSEMEVTRAEDLTDKTTWSWRKPLELVQLVSGWKWLVVDDDGQGGFGDLRSLSFLRRGLRLGSCRQRQMKPRTTRAILILPWD